MRQELKCSTERYANIDSCTLSRRFISRWSFSLWKNVTKEHISLLNQRLSNYRKYTLKRLFLLGWCAYCHQRGKRIRTIRKLFRSWRKVFDQKKHDRELLSIARQKVSRSRRGRCLQQWQSATYQSLVVHAYQIHRINEYIRTSRVLWFPHLWIRRSPYLVLISSWKLVG